MSQYTSPKQMNCLGHLNVDVGSITPLTGIPNGTEIMVMQAKGDGGLFWSDSPDSISDLAVEGIGVPADTSYVYAGNFNNFCYIGEALFLFYSSR